MKRLILLFLYMSALLVSLGAQEERLFREAERRFHGGEYQFAASRYERLIEEYPNSPYVADAKFRQALISMYQQKYPQALEALSRIVDRYPHTRFYEQIPFWQGYGHFRLGDYETALEMFEKAQGAKSENIRRDVLLYLSMTQKRLGQEEGALASARKLIAMLDELTEESEVLLLYTALLLENQRYQELYDLYGELNLDNLDPDIRRRILLYRAEALFQQEEYQDVEPLYNELLEGEEELKLIAFKRLFVLYGRTGQQEKQQEVFDKAQNELAGKPEALAEFLLRAGIQHFQAGRYDLARSFFQRIWRTVSIERVNGLVPLYLSRIMERGGELSEAVRMIEGYLQQSSDQREELLFALVRIQSKQSHWKEAVAGAELFLQDYPGSSKRAEIHYLYAYSLYRGGSHREALAVLQEGLAEGAKAELDLDMLRLRSRIYSRLERIDEAIEDLREYLPRRKGDSSAYIDLAKLAFSKQEWSLIADTLRRYREYREGETELGELALTDPIYIQLNYITALASLKQGDYRRSAEILAGLSVDAFVDTGLDDLLPHYLFYRGWSEYQLGEYDESIQWFSRLTEEYPDSRMYLQALYFQAWAAYADGKFEQSRRAFGSYSNYETDRSMVARSLFMYAKSTAALGKEEDALLVYQTIHNEYSGTSLADDALYERARLLQSLESYDEAAAVFLSVQREFPNSPLAEESLYKRGEIYFHQERYEEAMDAFYEHRLRYPQGELHDASLYWGGQAARAAGQAHGALLLWEKLIQEYSKSPLHDESLLEAARVLTELGEYRQAISYYSQFISSYPDQAETERAKQQSATLQRLLEGQGSREAELNATIEREGFDSPRGRQAAMDLARLYLYQYTERSAEAFDLLERLLKRSQEGSLEHAQARYLLGEFFWRRGDLPSAANEYVAAALNGGGDPDLIARSLLKAAQVAVEAGDTATAERMIRKIRSDYPHTQWATEAAALRDRMEERRGNR